MPGGYLLLAYTAQVLTGEIPLFRVPGGGLGYYVVQGLRPDKPAKALTIGLSDPLWAFVQCCWNGDRNLRPRVAEVVTRLGEAAANWRGLMPPCEESESAPRVPEEPMSDSMEHCKLEI